MLQVSAQWTGTARDAVIDACLTHRLCDSALKLLIEVSHI